MSILDIGCGNGFYGAVVRTYVDMGYGDKTRLVGIEPFADYNTKNLGWGHYTYTYVKTIQNYLVTAQNTLYDFILFLDVIEHMGRLEGLSIVEQLKDKLMPKGVLLVSTPGEFTEQKEMYGNPLERHVSFYEPVDFISRGFYIIRDPHKPCAFHQKMLVAKYVN
jgi:2-polyprenyl-3-methyl-5-hydroxy-6-metoxy-1,4-benzoquinol methylase